MKERQAVTGEYKPRYQKAWKKEKMILLDEFIRLTGYRRKSAIRVLSGKPAVREVLLYSAGKRLSTDEAVACLRMVWVFFWYK
jgi:hypothetical protein